MLENRDPSGGEARRNAGRSPGDAPGRRPHPADPLESAVLQTLRSSSKAMTPRELLKALNSRKGRSVGYPTINAAIGRLTENGLVGRWHDGHSYRYKPVSPAQDPGLTPRRTETSPAARPEIVDPADLPTFTDDADPQVLNRLHRFLSDDDT